MSTRPALHKIVLQFGVQIKKIRKVQNRVYQVISTGGKTFCLKQSYEPVAKLRWTDRTLSRLRKQGFTQIAWRNPASKEGRKLLVRSGKQKPAFTLTPWIEGRWPSPLSQNDMQISGKLLAQFHKTAQRIRIPTAGRVNYIGKWPAIFQGYTHALHTQIKAARRNVHDRALNEFLQTNGEEIMQRAWNAMQVLSSTNYRAACAHAYRTNSLCHGDGGPTNFILTAKGAYLIDFETLRMDLRSYDLYRVIYNSCKDHNWNFDIARAILDGYQSVLPLNQTDIQLTKTWLGFPVRTCVRLMRFKKAGARKKAQIINELHGFLNEDRAIGQFLLYLDNYIGKE